MEKINKIELLKKVLKSKIFWLITLWLFTIGFIYWFRSNYYFNGPSITIKAEWKCFICSVNPKKNTKVKANALVKNVLAVSSTPTPTTTPTPIPYYLQPVKKFLTPEGAKNREWVLEYVKKYYKGDDILCLDNLLKSESGYRTDALNEGGCGGIGQACPASKMNCALNDSALECQTQYVIGYIMRRYSGSPTEAWKFWLSRTPIDGKDVGNWY